MVQLRDVRPNSQGGLMSRVRAGFVVLLLALSLLALLPASLEASCCRTFCYTIFTPREYCNICEFYDSEGNPHGQIEACFPRSI